VGVAYDPARVPPPLPENNSFAIVFRLSPSLAAGSLPSEIFRNPYAILIVKK